MIDEVPSSVRQVRDYLTIGHWKWDISRDEISGDESVGKLFGLSEDDRLVNPSMKSLIAAIHPEDREMFSLKIEQCVRDGGLFRMVYRTRPAPGVQKWVLTQGQFSRRESEGHGTVQDITFAVEDNLLGPVVTDKRSERVSSADFIRNFSSSVDRVPFRPMIVTKNGRDRVYVSVFRGKG